MTRSSPHRCRVAGRSFGQKSLSPRSRLQQSCRSPGWSAASIYYHTSVSAGGNVALAREIEIGRIPANLTATLNANLKANADLGLLNATYVFATPVLGGQASASLTGIYGRNDTSLAGTLTGTLA